ncbi:MAG: hypothetical protein U0166_25575 [Acidobacteriota bacterium]
MKLAPWFKAVLYATFGSLLLTGVVWYFVDPAGTAAWLRPLLMKAHGFAAMGALVLFGILLAGHVPAGLAARKRQATGVGLVGSTSLLALTGYLLYYSGSDRIRSLASAAHTILGVVASVQLGAHGAQLARKDEARPVAVPSARKDRAA